MDDLGVPSGVIKHGSGKSPENGGLNRKITYFNGSFSSTPCLIPGEQDRVHIGCLVMAVLIPLRKNLGAMGHFGSLLTPGCRFSCGSNATFRCDSTAASAASVGLKWRHKPSVTVANWLGMMRILVVFPRPIVDGLLPIIIIRPDSDGLGMKLHL